MTPDNPLDEQIPLDLQRLGKWLLAGMLAAFCGVFLHEAGHYVPAYFFGAENLDMMPTSAKFDDESITAGQHVIVAVGAMIVTTVLSVVGI